MVSRSPRSPFALLTARILRLVSLARNSLNQFLIPAISLSVLFGVNGIKMVVDGNIPNTILGKGEVDIQPGQRGICAKSGKVFRDDHAHIARFDFREHFLKTGAVEVCTAVPIVKGKKSG